MAYGLQATGDSQTALAEARGDVARMNDAALRSHSLSLEGEGWGVGKQLSRAVMFVVVCFFTNAANAQEKFAAPDAAERVATSPTTGIASMMVSLLIVLAAVFAAAWVMRRLRGGAMGTRGAIQVIADLPLNTKERAVLVRVGREHILLGVAPGRVNTLHVFAEGREPVMPDAPTSGEASNVPPHLDFKSILRRSVGLR